MSPKDLSCGANVFIIYGASLFLAGAVFTIENLYQGAFEHILHLEMKNETFRILEL